ncbi:hypothetical protein FACS1894156_3810 [Bacteroidia bacterium]|nr:hypothetical protein FACS1894156_3810 [Bacteroidia bacterium]
MKHKGTKFLHYCNTQERRHVRLKTPIICMRSNAWLGYGYYFWYDEIDAIHWGHNSKKQTGYVELY